MIKEERSNDGDNDDEIIDGPMSDEELHMVLQYNPHYQRTNGVNPLHEEWTDREVMLLAPLWDTSVPLTRDELQIKLENHPVLHARPGQDYFRDTLYCYARYCKRRALIDGDGWLKSCENLSTNEGFLDITTLLNAHKAMSLIPEGLG